MSWKDKLKENQGGGNNTPTLGARAVQVKRNENGEVMFATWDKENSCNVWLKTITGVLVGQANKLSAFCTELGKNGGQYQSAYYFKNDKITVYGQGKPFYDGDYEGLLLALNAAHSDKPSKKKVLFIQTSDGLLAVETNMVIGIDKLRQYQGEILANVIKLTASKYDPKNPRIAPKSVDFLGKFALTNHPLYADIEIEEEITDGVAELLGLEEAIDAYAEWKKFKLGGGEEVVSTTEEIVEELKDIDEDDLPF